MRESIAISQLKHALVASIQADLSAGILADFCHELLSQLAENYLHGVLIDMSDVKTLDRQDIEALIQISLNVQVMGRQCIFVGFRPGIVMGLMSLGVDTSALCCAADLEQGLVLLRESQERWNG
ncbi:STAS domain-containing protein [Vibrio gazogenes]|uniref:RsbT antagonist protein RsbS n=1 Tax=Vibrio gazogenes DSM 21264 = NBRC 103151 TaxID=1123492 RepID=A0A1M5A644_VIBGA|nr:STAS domain-containing protein [Vibrio gazogenes]USP13341.1 STAS domain-containing protein [Vibrio gazogenes]SHF25597.1 rsbT antagonist protein RsbS [Vibrio gazogenes DSM 21264] [Vibrio gazogenes DSM 21264 = NBRC 103151]SJN56984.1 RsbT antagonist protein RsbS [Vibrio gazogenes]